MNPLRHKRRHLLLQRHLNEVMIDYCRDSPSHSINDSILSLLSWSVDQSVAPRNNSATYPNPHPSPRTRKETLTNGD